MLCSIWTHQVMYKNHVKIVWTCGRIIFVSLEWEWVGISEKISSLKDPDKIGDWINPLK